MSDLERVIARLRAEIEELSIDRLTKIPDRHLGERRLVEDEQRWKRGGYVWRVSMIDVDDFKAFNDKLGHQAGDAALHAVAQELASRVRAGDYLFRWGGEEFMITSLHPADPGTGRRRELFGTRLCEAVDFNTPVTVSIGTTTADDDDPYETAANLIERADSALYAAKQAGRNRSIES